MSQSLTLLCLSSLIVSSTALAQTQPPPAPYAPPPPYETQPAPAATPPGPPPPGAAAQPGYYPPPPPPGYSAPPGYAAAPGYSAPPGSYPPAYGVMPAPGAHMHDGFYLRLQLGGGFNRVTTSSGGSDVRFAGGGGAVTVAAGGAIAPNLIIYGTILTSTAQDPDVSQDGTSLGSANGNMSITGIGPGVAYYLMPVNVYFAASLLASRLTFTDPDGNSGQETNVGFTFEGLVGKEWWVSDNWGIGASGQLLLGTMKDKEPLFLGEDAPTWRVVAFNLLFSATFN